MKFQFDYADVTNYVEVSAKSEYAIVTRNGLSEIVTPAMLDAWKLSLFWDDVAYFKAFSTAFNEAENG